MLDKNLFIGLGLGYLAVQAEKRRRNPDGGPEEKSVWVTATVMEDSPALLFMQDPDVAARSLEDSLPKSFKEVSVYTSGGKSFISPVTMIGPTRYIKPVVVVEPGPDSMGNWTTNISFSVRTKLNDKDLEKVIRDVLDAEELTPLDIKFEIEN